MSTQQKRAALASIGVAIALALALGCTEGLPRPTSAQLDAARRNDPSITLDDLSHGRSLYVARCGNCHRLREPNSLPPDAWAHTVAEMQEKQGVRLSPEEARDVVRYLESASAVSQR
jgi:mono/diheme cytochrome c family protein